MGPDTSVTARNGRTGSEDFTEEEYDHERGASHCCDLGYCRHVSSIHGWVKMAEHEFRAGIGSPSQLTEKVPLSPTGYPSPSMSVARTGIRT
jgi:hypothetical protein